MENEDRIVKEMLGKFEDFQTVAREYEKQGGTVPTMHLVCEMLIHAEGRFYEHIGTLEACKKTLFEIVDRGGCEDEVCMDCRVKEGRKA